MTATLTQVGPVFVPGPPPEPEIPPGDADRAMTAARRCLAAAQALHDIQTHVAATSANLHGRQMWCGPASEAFQRSSSETAAWFDNAARALAVVAAALLAYGQALAEATGMMRRARLRADDARAQRSALLAEIESLHSRDPGLGSLFGGSFFDPATVALQRRADALGSQIQSVQTTVEAAAALARRAEHTAAGAFDEAAAMTRAARERVAATRAGPLAETRGSSPWLEAGELIGLGLADLALGAADAAQVGLDPVTDAAELASLARTRAVASRLVGRLAPDGVAAGFEAGALEAAERDVLVAVEQQAESDWLAEARAQLPDHWGPGMPASRGTGYRWIEPEGEGTYLRIDRGRPRHPDPVQQVDHVHIRQGWSKVGRDGERLPDRTTGLTAAELAERAELEHVPLSEWLTWKNWWQQ